MHAGLGDWNAAADCVERALEVRDVHLMFIQVDPKWEAGLAHPRIAAAIARCGFALPA